MQLTKKIIKSSLNDVKKAKICGKLSKTEENLIDGGDSYLQLLDAFCFMNSVLIED